MTIFCSRSEELARWKKIHFKHGAETNSYFKKLEKFYYTEGIQKSEIRWSKHNDLKGGLFCRTEDNLLKTMFLCQVENFLNYPRIV